MLIKQMLRRELGGWGIGRGGGVKGVRDEGWG